MGFFKRPVWISAVPVYFYLGGLAGAALVLGAAAQLFGGSHQQRTMKRCRQIALAGQAAGTALLIADLGRPERFLNMLRVFRPTSPLSVGSWILASSSALTTLSLMPLGRLSRLSGLGAGVLGIPLAGYTGVVLTHTAIPAWQRHRLWLPVIFVASATASAAAALELFDLDDREWHAVRRFGTVGRSLDLITMRFIADAPSTSILTSAAAALTAAGLLIGVFASSAGLRRAAGLAGTLGALALRFSVFKQGFRE